MDKTNNYNFWIDKICNSKVFSSQSDVRLFRYLADATIHDSVLKETVIAIDVFNRDSSFNPGDNSIVRSSIYNLRKKLDSYYQTEGTDDLICISIPKGSYHVVFQEKRKVKPSLLKISSGMRVQNSYVLSIGLFVTCVLFAFLYFSLRGNIQKMKTKNLENYFWADFIKSDKPLLIVLGDYFMIEKSSSSDSSQYFVLNPMVNTQEDFTLYREVNQEIKNQLKAFGMSFFGEEIPWCLIKIIEMFRGTSKTIELKYASALLDGDLRDKDIIFIGDFSTLGLLKGFLEKTHYQVSLSPPTIKYGEQKQHFTETMTLINTDASEFQNDYAIVAKISGHQSNQMMFFLSFSPFGKTEAIYRLTDPKFITEIEKITDQQPIHWDLLLKISGLRTTGFYYEILRFEEIKP